MISLGNCKYFSIAGAEVAYWGDKNRSERGTQVDRGQIMRGVLGSTYIKEGHADNNRGPWSHFRHDVTGSDLCLGQTFLQSGRLDHQREVGAKASCQTGSRENTFIHIKNDQGKNQGRNSQRGLCLFLRSF